MQKGPYYSLQADAHCRSSTALLFSHSRCWVRTVQKRAMPSPKAWHTLAPSAQGSFTLSLLVLTPLCAADIDREIMELKRQEQQLIKDIKTAAKQGNQASMKILAKSLVRLRGQVRASHKSRDVHALYVAFLCAYRLVYAADPVTQAQHV